MKSSNQLEVPLEQTFKSKPTTEGELEEYIISLFESQGYLFSEGGELKRENYQEVFLIEDLTNFLKPRYPKLHIFEGYSDIRYIADDLQRSDKSLYDFNKDFFLQKLSNEVIYKRERDDEEFSISLIDFNNPSNNIFRIVSQLAVEGKKPRRVDLVIYINGIPFIIWELKTPSDPHLGLNYALEQLQKYEEDIPNLFKYNAFTVLCDGINSVKYGVSWKRAKSEDKAQVEDFMIWSKISDEEDARNKDSLTTTIEGLFNKERLLSVIRDFVWFKDSQSDKKIICRYPQYYATTKMFKSIKEHLKPDGSGKGGIYFGATGSGKSFTMLFLSRLLLRSKELNHPSILLIADRVEISEQLSSLFQNSTDFLGDKNIRNIEARKELSRSLKNLRAGGVFLTNIQKFEEGAEILSERNNIICISDEAHRSQHNFDQELKIVGDQMKKTMPFAKRLHESLPNATYVGFTATPIDKTMDVFGEIVDKYTMDQSIKDGITVSIKLEVRRGWLKAKQEIAQKVEQIYQDAKKEGVSEERIEEDQKVRTQLQVISGVKERIEIIAKDIVEHYEKRCKNEETSRKAMIVANGRKIGYSFYEEIKKLKPEWCQNDEKERAIGTVRLVMTRTEKDNETMYKLIGDEKYQKSLATEFKDKDSNFKIAIVSDKWLTGFDVPCLDTMYLDRIFTDKTLIQTVSRVNRKYEKKHYGLVVSYWPIERHWKEALRKVEGGERGGATLEEIASRTRDKLELLNKLFYDFDKKAFLNLNNEEQQTKQIINYIERKGERFQAEFKALYTDFISFYDSWASAELSEELGEERAFYKLVWKYWSQYIRKSQTPLSENTKQKIEEHMQNIFEVEDLAQYSFGYLTVTFPSEKEYKNKEISREEKLRKAQRLGEALSRTHKNYGKSFMERLAQLQAEYESLWREQRKLEAIEDEEERQRAMEEFEERQQELDKARDELVNSGYEKMNSHNLKGWTQEEQIFYDQLLDFNEKFKFNIPEDQVLSLTNEINDLWVGIKDFVKGEARYSVTEKIRMELYVLIDKYHFYETEENYSETTNLIIEELLDCFKRMTEQNE